MLISKLRSLPDPNPNELTKVSLLAILGHAGLGLAQPSCTPTGVWPESNIELVILLHVSLLCFCSCASGLHQLEDHLWYAFNDFLQKLKAEHSICCHL